MGATDLYTAVTWGNAASASANSLSLNRSIACTRPLATWVVRLGGCWGAQGALGDEELEAACTHKTMTDHSADFRLSLAQTRWATHPTPHTHLVVPQRRRHQLPHVVIRVAALVHVPERRLRELVVRKGGGRVAQLLDALNELPPARGLGGGFGWVGDTTMI